MIKIEAARENTVESVLNRHSVRDSAPRQDCTTQPGGRPSCRISSQPIIVLPCFAEDGRDPAIEICLQGVNVRKILSLKEGLDLRISLPLFAVDFVAADVQVGVREDGVVISLKNASRNS